MTPGQRIAKARGYFWWKEALLCPDCAKSPMGAKSPRCGECARKRDLIKYREIRRATARVHSAIKAGKLPRPVDLMCADCGKGATEYDHRDYSKPLEVDPVCHPCNKRRGPGLNNGRAA